MVTGTTEVIGLTDSREVELVANNLAAIVVVVKVIITHCAVFSVVEDVNMAESSVGKKDMSVCENKDNPSAILKATTFDRPSPC